MIHAFKIENDSLIIDVQQVLMYEPLAVIYKRDDSPNKEFAFKEYKYIYFLADNKGFINRNGLKGRQAHLYATDNAGLRDSYEPDDVVKRAIQVVKNSLVSTPVEKLLDATIKGLNASTTVVDMIVDYLSDIIDNPESKSKDILAAQANIKSLIATAKEIPDMVDNLIELKDKYDKAERGINLLRGNKEYRPSYDGNDEGQFTSDLPVEVLK